MFIIFFVEFFHIRKNNIADLVKILASQVYREGINKVARFSALLLGILKGDLDLVKIT